VNHRQAHAALLVLANPNKAEFLAGFFKTGKGQYAREIVSWASRFRSFDNFRQFGQLDLTDCERLLQSAYNDERLLSLLILVEQYRREMNGVKNKVYQIYLNNRHRVNNWESGGRSAPYIVGAHLLQARPVIAFMNWHNARSLWDRRIGILATLTFIRADDFTDTPETDETAFGDEHDLNAQGVWLDVAGGRQRNQSVLEDFLRSIMTPCRGTMLRYAIERFSPAKRTGYLTGKSGDESAAFPGQPHCFGHCAGDFIEIGDAHLAPCQPVKPVFVLLRLRLTATCPANRRHPVFRLLLFHLTE